MKTDCFKMKNRSCDLPDTEESWKQMTYQQRRQEIFAYIQKTKGALPSRNMICIREVEFKINNHIKLYHLVNLIPQIKDKYVLDCFQVTIDRENNMAHMLFDWYDRDAQKCVVFYKTKEWMLSVLIFQTLNLPLPIKGDGVWLRYFLLEDYTKDPDIFDKVDEWVKRQQPSQKNYSVIKNALDYVKQKCQGLVK